MLDLRYGRVGASAPVGCNLIFGQSHFIKSVEDISGAIVGSVPGVKFAVAFTESSGKNLVRCDGDDEELISKTTEHVLKWVPGIPFLR
jgi:adenosine/AMP kinase